MTYPIFIAYALGYIGIATVLAVSVTKIDNVAWEYNYKDATRSYLGENLFLMTLWPLVIWFIVFSYGPELKPLYNHVQSEKARRIRQNSKEIMVNKRKQIIREINADIDRLEQTRREDILSGRPIIDVRDKASQKYCYVCNKGSSPYDQVVSKVINTISGVPAHEPCLMADLLTEKD